MPCGVIYSPHRVSPHHNNICLLHRLLTLWYPSALQVCRSWNMAFHMPELWRCFEFELNQPASSYLRATHPDLIKQIIKKHSNHLRYVSFKVRRRDGAPEDRWRVDGRRADEVAEGVWRRMGQERD